MYLLFWCTKKRTKTINVLRSCMFSRSNNHATELVLNAVKDSTSNCVTTSLNILIVLSLFVPDWPSRNLSLWTSLLVDLHPKVYCSIIIWLESSDRVSPSVIILPFSLFKWRGWYWNYDIGWVACWDYYFSGTYSGAVKLYSSPDHYTTTWFPSSWSFVARMAHRR